jgi:hypothetical protein
MKVSPSSQSHQDICSECGSPVPTALRFCPTCQTDAGAPNVRLSRTKENLNALVGRLIGARNQTRAKGCSKEFRTLWKLLRDTSVVVIAMPASIAKGMFENPRAIYQNYETLVGDGIQKPVGIDSDIRRCGVSGTLFGSYAEHIRYGALSLTPMGLPTYGNVYCCLRSVAIEKRTSFLETNSYRFVQEHRVIAGSKIPLGYRTCWKYRQCLALTKVANRLETGQNKDDWQAMLIQSNGKDRNDDCFVEAHIYDGFDKNAVQSLTPIPDKKLTREQKLDLDIAMSKFKPLGGKTP